jgi:hypothetical protein
MRRLLLLPVLVVLGACSTKTLINLNVDADSFLADSAKSGTINVTAGQFQTRVPDDDGDGTTGNDADGVPVSLSALSILERASLRAKVRVDTSATGSLEVYVAPQNVADIYQAQYRVLQGSNAGGNSFEATVELTANAADPARAQAFNAIKSGAFRFGVQLIGSAPSATTIRFELQTLEVSVSGYPVRLF